MAANFTRFGLSFSQRITTKPLVAGSGRLLSLDVTRGLAVVGMILVVSAGSWDHRYRPLLHADWYGWTLADMIFPLFLFAVGLAITFSFCAHLERGVSQRAVALKVLRRAAIILIIGLVLNAVPAFDLATLRIPGILQRIAVCYALAGFVTLAFWGADGRAAWKLFVATMTVGVVILILYWELLALVPVPGFGAGRLDSLGSLPTYLDRRIFGISHLWTYGLTPGYGVSYDPEGIRSTLPATASVLIGVVCGLWLKLRPIPSQRVMGLAAAGALLIIAGVALQSLIPMAKKIWTDSFVLFSGGFAVLVFTMAYWLSDIRGFKTWSYPLRVFGANAILAFALSQAIGAYSDHPFGVRAGGFAALHAVIPDAKAASLVYAVGNSVVIFAVLLPLYNRRIFLRA